MKRVRCDHCGIVINKKDAIPCNWKEVDLTWYHCKRCDKNVFSKKMDGKETD